MKVLLRKKDYIATIENNILNVEGNVDLFVQDVKKARHLSLIEKEPHKCNCSTVYIVTETKNLATITKIGSF